MNFLSEIVSHKREEVTASKLRRPASSLADSPHFAETPRSFSAALSTRERFHVIAEVKKASPSAGVLASTFDPANIAASYAEHGASAISVLTDERFFGGSCADLTQARSSVTVPLLRKDFIIDPYQIAEAKSIGADAVLLIAAILDPVQHAELAAAAREAQLDVLLELHTLADIESVAVAPPAAIGINNRDLTTFRVDLGTSARLAALLPRSFTLISESGIRTAEDCRMLREAGLHAALVGESFMRSGNPGEALRELLEGIHHAA